MNDNLTTNASNEAESPAFLVGAVKSSAGKYVNGVYVNESGKQICEWCGSEYITDPISEDILNGICNDCGSHW